MFLRGEAPVLVVGAGPVGMVAALALTEEEVDILVVDEEIGTASHSYALALHPRTLDLLSELGIPADSLRPASRIDSLAFYDGRDRRAEVDLADISGRHPFLLVLRQSHLEEALEDRLRQAKRKVHWNHRMSGLRLEEDRVVVELDRLDSVSTGYPVAVTEREVVKRSRAHPRFVLGADGHRSLVRRQLEIPFEAVAAPQYFGVFEFACEGRLEREVRVVLDEETTSVLWPLPDGCCRWSFELPGEKGEPGESRYKSRYAVQVGSEIFPHLTESLLHELLAQRAPWFRAYPGEIFWSTLVRFERRLAGRFGRDRAWLAGDSAHLTGPVGIQSMNVGIREARDLARTVADVLRGNVTRSAFDSYDRERKDEWHRLLGIERSLTVREGADDWVARNAARILPCLPASGADLRCLAGKLGLEFAPARQRVAAGNGEN